MVSLRHWNDKVAAVYGAGPSGLSVLSALGRAGAHLLVWDDNERIRDKLARSKIVCTPPDEWPWEELDAVIPGQVNRSGFSLQHPVVVKARQAGVPVRSDIDIFAEAVAALPEAERPKIIGITGTFGKSLTSSMVTHILKEAGREAFLAGDAGRPILSLPDGGANSAYVLEIPLRAMAFTRGLRCDAAILLNVADTDIRFFNKPEAIVKTATRLFRTQERDDVMIIGADDLIGQKVCTAITSNLSSQTFRSRHLVPCSGEAALGLGVFSLDGHLFDARADKTASLGDLSQALNILGPHLNHDAAAASAACLHLGVKSSLIGRALLRWPGLKHRMQITSDDQGLVVLNDSIASRLKPTLAALKSASDILWVGGGAHRQTGYGRLESVSEHVEKAFLFGEAALKIQAAAGSSFASVIYDTPEQAIEAALMEAASRAGQDQRSSCQVVLSPGCPGGNPVRLSAMLDRTMTALRKGHAA